MSITIQELTESIICNGISVRTTNKAENNPDCAKIGEMWQTFYQIYFPKGCQSDIYGIYHNYESDVHGEFDVTASWRQTKDTPAIESNHLIEVTIPEGQYLVFSEIGNMPDAVINAWQNVWTYFNNDNNKKYTRRYDVDFEHYVSESQVDVYIGIRHGLQYNE